MKQVKIESIIMLFVLMMFLVVSCGSDDSGNKTPQDSQVTNERTGAVSQLCNMFGINADDYYDYWMPYTKDDKVVISLANKKTNRLLVAIYDTNKKSVIYTNTDIPFLTTLNNAYYENQFEGKLANVYPRFCETKKGFIINVLLWYNEKGEVDISSSIFDKAMCIQNLYFYNGSTTKTTQMEPSSKSFDGIIYWYNNSCVLNVAHTINYYCYTDEGELKFSDKWILGDGDNYAVSYSQYIHIDFTSPISIIKYDVLNPEVDGTGGLGIWSIKPQLIDNYTDDVKVSFDIIDRSTTIWTISAKFVWENGSTKAVNFTLNVDTGEYKVLEN